MRTGLDITFSGEEVDNLFRQIVISSSMRGGEDESSNDFDENCTRYIGKHLDDEPKKQE